MKAFIEKVIFLLPILFVFTGCESLVFEMTIVGCVENRYESYSGQVEYYCLSDNGYEDIPYNTVVESHDGTKSIYYKEKSCIDLGYTKIDEGKLVSPGGINVPGKNGQWRDEVNNNNGNGNGDGTTPAFCKTGFVAPTSDVQINSFCNMAYAALCAGIPSTDPRVVENCKLYRQMQGLGTGIPDCKYCPK